MARAQHGGAVRSPEEPLHTITASDGDHNTVVAPLFARTAHGDMDRNGKRRGQGAHSAAEPFPTIATSQDSALVAAHVTKFRSRSIGHALDDPLATVTANSFHKRPGGAAPLGLATAFLNKLATGNSAMPAHHPLQTIEGRSKLSTVAAFLSHQYGSATNGGQGDPQKPLKTVTTGGHHAVIAAHIEQANGSPEGDRPLPGRKADAPLSTIVAKGCTQRIIETTMVGADALPTEMLGRAVRTAAFLLKYYGSEQDPRLDAPLHTVTTKDRYAVVTVVIDAETYILVDIGMRMLNPRELFNAQGFPPDYIIDRDSAGLPITKTAQTAKCGNSVSPPVAEALVIANARVDSVEREAA